MKTLKMKTVNLPRKGRASSLAEVEARVAAWAEIEAEARTEGLDPAEYTLPRTSVGGLIATATHLAAQAPASLEPGAARALKALTVARDMATTHQWDALAPVKVDVLTPRNEVVRLVGAHLRTLADVAASQMEQAKVAERLHEVLFGQLTSLRDLESREFWSKIERARKRLVDAPELKAQLAELVAPALTAHLFQVHAKLGEALGMTVRQEAVPVLAAAQVQAFLRRRIRRYVVLLLATWDETLEGRHVLERALRPIVALQERRRRRRGGAVEEEVAPP